LRRGRGSITTGDMDGDNDLDIVLLSKECNILWLMENQLTSRGGFIVGYWIHQRRPASYSVAVGELTADGQLDIVTGGLNAVEVYQNVGSRSFKSVISFMSGMGISCRVNICLFYESFVIQDVDGDGFTNRRNAVWFPQTSPLQIGSEKAFISTLGDVDVMAVGNLDNGGLNDVVVGDAYNVDAYFGRIIETTAPMPSPPQPQPTVATSPSPQPTVTAPSLPQPGSRKTNFPLAAALQKVSWTRPRRELLAVLPSVA
jgi:hypothetical protein